MGGIPEPVPGANTRSLQFCCLVREHQGPLVKWPFAFVPRLRQRPDEPVEDWLMLRDRFDARPVRVSDPKEHRLGDPELRLRETPARAGQKAQERRKKAEEAARARQWRPRRWCAGRRQPRLFPQHQHHHPAATGCWLRPAGPAYCALASRTGVYSNCRFDGMRKGLLTCCLSVPLYADIQTSGVHASMRPCVHAYRLQASMRTGVQAYRRTGRALKLQAKKNRDPKIAVFVSGRLGARADG